MISYFQTERLARLFAEMVREQGFDPFIRFEPNACALQWVVEW